MSKNKYYTSSIDLLEKISSNANNINYKVARKFAKIDYVLLQKKNQWTDSILSDLPIVIFNHHKFPMYYEFRIYKNDEVIGAITTNIQKNRGFPIAFEINHPQFLNDIDEKYPNFALVDCGYPTIGYCENSLSDTWIIRYFDNSSTDIQVPDKDFNINKELNDVYDSSHIENYKQEILMHLNYDHHDFKSFWNYVDINIDRILNTNIILKQNISTEKVSANLDPTWNWFVDYADSIYGWCGPSLMTFFLSVAGNWENKSPEGIRELYETVEKIIGTGPVIVPGLNKVFTKKNSPFSSLPYKISSLPLLSFQTERIMNNMRINKMPIASLINYLTIGKGWGSWHWRAILEIEKISYFDKFKTFFSWWNWHPVNEKNKFEYIYTIFDNGYTLSENPKYVKKYDIKAYKGIHYFKEKGHIPFIYFFPFEKL